MAYIAMKLLSGRTLQDRLQEAGAIGLEELLAVLGPAAGPIYLIERAVAEASDNLLLLALFNQLNEVRRAVAGERRGELERRAEGPEGRVRVPRLQRRPGLLARIGRQLAFLAVFALGSALAAWPLTLSADRLTLTYAFDTQREDTGIAELLGALHAQGIAYRDLRTSESSLEDIFVSLVHEQKAGA